MTAFRHNCFLHALQSCMYVYIIYIYLNVLFLLVSFVLFVFVILPVDCCFGLVFAYYFILFFAVIN